MFSPDLIEKNYYQLLMIGHYIDVRTSDNQWRMALITDRDNKYLTISFQSYDHKEQHVYANSFRVAPLRMYTEGFHNQYFRKISNQVLIPISDLQKHLQMMKKKYLQFSDSSTEVAFELTQYFRGQLFITIYSLLFNEKQLKPQQVVSVVMFLQGFIDFIGDVCQNCLKYANQYFQNPPIKQLYLVNPKIALIYSLQEILIMFNFLVKAQSNKYVNIFRYNQEINYEKLLKRALEKKKIDKKITDLFLLNDNNGRWLPFGVRKQCLRFILKYLPNFKLPKYTKKDYVQYMQIYPLMMTLKSQKNYEFEYIMYLVETLVQLSPFQGKLKALQQLRKMLEKDAKLQYFQPINIIDLLAEKGVLEYMLNPQNFKPQIFKRLVPILNFYCKSKNLTQKQISSLFKLAASGHQSEMTTIYEIITQITQIAPFQSLDQIFTDICQLDINNEQTLTFIKNFTIRAIKSHSKTQSFFKSIFGTKSKSDKYDFYGLNLFWKQTQDNGKIIEKHIPFALDLIRQIFNEEIFHSERQQYLANCINYLEKNKNFGQSIKVMTGIISSYPSATYISQGRRQVVEKLDKKYEVLEIVMKGIKQYQKMKSPKVNFKDTLKYFFNFLEQYADFLKYPLKIDYIEYLWNLPENNLLLEYLRKNKDLRESQSGQTYKIKYMKKLPLELLKDILTKFGTKGFFNNKQSITQSEVLAIDDIFLSYHFTVDYIHISQRGTIRYINPNYIGIDFYVNALQKQMPPKLYEFVLIRLIDLYMRPKSEKIQERVQNWQKTIMLLLNLFKKQPVKCIQALKIFLTFIEGKKLRQNVTIQGNTDIIVSDGQIQKTISLAKNSTIYTLRKLIGKVFNIKGDFLMYNMQMKKQVTFVEQEDYSVNAMSYCKKGPSIILKYIKSQLHQLEASLDLFKDKISNQDTIYNTIFSFLNTNNELHKQVWQIMQLLPTNKSIINKLKKCEKYTIKDWQSIILQKGNQELLYSLNIVRDLMKKDTIWTLTMCQTGGYTVVYKLLLKNLKNSTNLLQTEILCSIVLQCLQKMKKDIKIQTMKELIQELSNFLKNLYKQSNDKPLKLINVILSLLMWSSKFVKYSLQEFLQKDQFFFTLLQSGLFEKKDQYSNTFNQEIMPNLVLTNFKSSQKKLALLTKLIKEYLNIEFLTEKNTLENYFVFLIDVLHSVTKEQQAKFFSDEAFGTIFNQFVTKVLKGEFIDPSKSCFNDFNFGALKLINYQLSSNIKTIENLSNELCQNFLFNVQKKRLKHQKCKRLIYEILKKIYYSDTEKFDYFAQQLSHKLQKAEWRKNLFSSWILEADKNQKKQPYCGLQNLAATCYINCLFQQLFMIQTFRDSFLKVDSRNYRQCVESNQIFQFQKILSNLKYGNKKSYTTRPFCQSFITYQGRPIDPMVQSDADEFFNTLMEKTQTFLRQKDRMHILQSNFQGTLSNQLNCEGCPHNSQKLQNFLSIGVNIKNKKTLDQALKGYTQGQILDGDNAYLCQPCNKKVKTLKRLCIKQLPNILVIVLKRFEFNYDEMRKVKLNHELRFSQQLNMKNYMASFLANEQTGPDQDYSYNLRGVVIHGGTAQGGHYYSFIKDKTKWYEFNDETISEINLQKIESDGFGGEDRDIDNQLKFQKHKNAYLLFYEKKNWKKFNVKEEDQTFNDILKQNVLLHNSNRNFMSFALDPFFIRFIQNTLMVDNIKTAHFGLLFFHVVVLRDKNRDENVANFYRLVQSRLEDKSVSEWFINQITPKFIKQFYIQAPKMCRYLSLGLLKKAISVLKEVPEKFIQTLMFSLNKKGMTPFAYIFDLLSENESNQQFFIKYQYPQKVLNFLLDKKIETASVMCDSESSYFGQDASQKDKQVQYCPHALIKSLRRFDVEYDDLMRLLQIYNGRQSIKIIVTKMITNKQKIQQLQQALQLFLKKITENEFSKQSLEKYSIIFSIAVRAKTTDKLQTNRIKLVILSLNQFFVKTQNMYDPVDTILREINSLALANPQFKKEWKQYLQADSNLKKILTTWVKQAQKPHFMNKIEEWKKKVSLLSFQQRREYEKTNKIRIDDSVKWMFAKENQEISIEKSEQKIMTAKNAGLGDEVSLGSKKVKVKEHLGFLTKVQYQKQNKWAFIEKSEIELYQYL